MAIILSSYYFGPVQAFCHMLRSEKIFVEQHDNYSRRTYRNRTTILVANGPMNLIVPVVKPKEKTKTKDIRISYDTNWQKNHWRSIVSAYNSSPFFEYYRDDIIHIYEKKWDFLIDLNIETLQRTAEMLELEAEIEFSKEYLDPAGPTAEDLREVIMPKKDPEIYDPSFKPVRYRQVFSETMDFVPNLSILDLIFNKGPEAVSVLEGSIRK